jgi:citrate/tricarballylate utilization protein
MRATDAISVDRSQESENEESPTMGKARRAMEVCNACRYCEGFCAVFPAMELHRAFSAGDLNYLANLCHGCRACYYACQYAPPHEFGINLPRTLAELRSESYEACAWPAPLAALFRRGGLVMAAVPSICAIGLFLVVLLVQGSGMVFVAQPMQPGASFFRLIPYAAMLWPALITFCFSLVALAFGYARFRRDAGGAAAFGRGQAIRALRDAATLKNLGGGGHGCNDRDEGFGTQRRRLHHALGYGFLLCLAATVVATIEDHLLGWRTPYGFFSLPVLLGSAGGTGMLVGSCGLLWLKLTGDPEPTARQQLGADAGLLLLLLLVAFTGLLLLALRATAAMGTVLAVHLGLVLALFLTLPYGKMVHGLYRFGALLRHAADHR